MKDMNWGEAILAAIVGYFGNKILQPVGAPILVKAQTNPYTNAMAVEVQNEMLAKGEQVNAGSVGATLANKLLGIAAIAKPGYDVARGKKLTRNDKNILIPFAIGTVFDAQTKNNNASSGVWK